MLPMETLDPIEHDVATGCLNCGRQTCYPTGEKTKDYPFCTSDCCNSYLDLLYDVEVRHEHQEGTVAVPRP